MMPRSVLPIMVFYSYIECIITHHTRPEQYFISQFFYRGDNLYAIIAFPGLSSLIVV
jgi:hypothetical protein